MHTSGLLPRRFHSFRTARTSVICCAFAIAGSAAALASEGFSIQINPGPGLLANPAAMDAFNRAAQEWSAWITSPITVYVDADLATFAQGGAPFDANVIGQTSYTTYAAGADLNLDYTLVRNAMAARSDRPGNEILAFLPTTSEIQAQVPSGAEFDNTTIGVLRANQRALGLLPATDTRADGTIFFNSAFSFDYNRYDANGVGAGLIDFQTAAAHEIGHLLGFLSDVDDFDSAPGLDSDNLTTLDLFRFPTAHIPTTGLQFQTFSRVLAPGVESVFSDASHQYAMSTGASEGDGNQAGHWKDDFLVQDGTITVGPLIGIMDPTLPAGTSESIGPADVRAMSLIGYDVVPEPSGALLLLAGGACLATRRLRRSQLAPAV